ncbi:hypothetical protein ILUMI_13326 [Ignelater luminosus]|uniref:Sulfotransferase domain-containing protein n=1 Tax=Ignelater luminosus TaxID=2038154 RepID=A0A8K0CWY2_IGNLU|nr:hypothetical protein ILUMI_13326 [Ignelater luminosus]
MDYLNVEPVTTDDEIGRIIHEKILNDLHTGFVLLGEDRTCMPEHFLNYAERIKNFEVKNEDVWVASYPKTGTTWTQEMVWMIANNVDIKAGEKSLSDRFPFLELSSLGDERKLYKALNLDPSEYEPDSYEFTKDMKSPRFIKTHLPFSLLPDQFQNGSKTPKIIYVSRNPKDACVSFCHHGRLLEGWRTDLESFAKLYMADKVMYGSYWKHILGYWEKRNSLNILFIKYEEMKANLPEVIKKVAKFLEKELEEEQIELLTKHLSFESMKNNRAVNVESFVEKLRERNLCVEDGAFMRSGVVGKYKEELSPETIKKFDEWIKKNVVGTSFEQEYNLDL